MISSENPGRLARDAYTSAHLLIVAGIVATAAATHLLLAEPSEPGHELAWAIVLGGPALFLLGTTLFQWMTTRDPSLKRVVAAILILASVPLAPHVSILARTVAVTTLLTALAIWELRNRPISRCERAG
ncbi:MAG: low temperature requirement protein A [Solirubrobacterales bacterium]